MKSMEGEWELYRDACYPQGCNASQDTECRQSFFSGALSVLKLISTAAEHESEDEAVKILEAVVVEVSSECRRSAARATRQHNN